MKFLYYVLILVSFLLCVRMWFKFYDKLVFYQSDFGNTTVLVFGISALLITGFCGLFVYRIVKK